MGGLSGFMALLLVQVELGYLAVEDPPRTICMCADLFVHEHSQTFACMCYDQVKLRASQFMGTLTPVLARGQSRNCIFLSSYAIPVKTHEGIRTPFYCLSLRNGISLWYTVVS